MDWFFLQFLSGWPNQFSILYSKPLKILELRDFNPIHLSKCADQKFLNFCELSNLSSLK